MRFASIVFFAGLLCSGVAIRPEKLFVDQEKEAAALKATLSLKTRLMHRAMEDYKEKQQGALSFTEVMGEMWKGNLPAAERVTGQLQSWGNALYEKLPDGGRLTRQLRSWEDALSSLGTAQVLPL